MISLNGAPKGDRYQFSVRASDNGYPVQSSITNVQIIVKAWDEPVMSFNKSEYNISVPEGLKESKPILVIKAGKEGYRGPIRYDFRDGNMPFTEATKNFRIDEFTGEIYLIRELDFEDIPSYKLMVRARDANKTDSTTCFIYVHVVNKNDNEPKFESPLYEFNTAEDLLIGSNLVQVKAHDLDNPSGVSLRYLFDSSDTQKTFTLDQNSGWLSLAAPLDRETKAMHQFQVQVDDGHNYDMTTIKIYLFDVNDSPPEFTNEPFHMKIKEDTLIDQSIGKVLATDKDLNSRLEYFVGYGKDSHYFEVDQISGDVFVKKELSERSYTFPVIAYDGIHRSFGTVNVDVIPVNNHAPLCIPSFYKLSIDENKDLSNQVLQVLATDEDRDDVLHYSIQGEGVNKFFIDEKTGEDNL